MEYPQIDLQELEKQKKKIFEERLKFIELYINWLKKHKVKIYKINKE